MIWCSGGAVAMCFAPVVLGACEMLGLLSVFTTATCRHPVPQPLADA